LNWTEDKLNRLKQLYDSGKGWLEISKVMDTTSDTVRMKYRQTWGETGAISGTTVTELPVNAKILLFDAETSPLCVLTWGLWDQNINIDAILQDWHLLSWSAKWLFSDKILSDVLTAKEAIDHSDRRIVQSMWKLLNEADIIIAHNGNSFDVKKLNTRFLFHKIPPPKNYQSVDTLVVAKYTFKFSSNKLAYINRFLGIPQKTDTDFELWKKCYFGDKQALKSMEEYNRNDVSILEDLYLRLRPYIKGHPNLNLWSDDNISICPNCASPKLNWGGHYYTYTGKYKSFRCNDCGAVGRSRQLDLDKEKRKSIVK
jgi:hypothetical protein